MGTLIFAFGILLVLGNTWLLRRQRLIRVAAAGD